MLSAADLRSHVDYHRWASLRLLDAASSLPEVELNRDFATADRSVLGTLVHLYAADRTWLARLEKRTPPAFVTPEDHSFEVVQRAWPQLLTRWQQWAATLADETAGGLLDYHDLKGNAWRHPVWQLVLHVVNHGSHHRGQISGFLRSMGHTPPNVDLLRYIRDTGH